MSKSSVVGLLWYDGSTMPFERKVSGAVDRYRIKYGQQPDAVFVNPVHMDGKEEFLVMTDGGPVMVLASRTEMPNHFFIGVKREGG